MVSSSPSSGCSWSNTTASVCRCDSVSSPRAGSGAVDTEPECALEDGAELAGAAGAAAVTTDDIDDDDAARTGGRRLSSSPGPGVRYGRGYGSCWWCSWRSARKRVWGLADLSRTRTELAEMAGLGNDARMCPFVPPLPSTSPFGKTGTAFVRGVLSSGVTWYTGEGRAGSTILVTSCDGDRRAYACPPC